MNSLEAFNQSLFLQINASLTTPVWEMQIALFMADFLIFVIPLALVSLWFWGDATERNLSLKACLVAFVALGVNQIIIRVWPHPRPFMIGLGHAFIPHAADPSFPSDHVTIFAGVGLSLLLGHARSVVGWAMLLLGLCVAWARVFLGVHFPLDMLGAVAVAFIVWVVISMPWSVFGNPITQAIEHVYRYLFARPIARGLIRR